MRWMLGAFAAAVAVAAGAVLLLRDDAPGTPPRLDAGAVVADARIEPRQHLFGDTVSAHVDVILDRRRVDPASVSVQAVFDPYEPSAPMRIERVDAGHLTRVRFAVRLRCLGEDCVSVVTEQEPFAFPRGAVLVDGERAATFRWPEIAVLSRVGHGNPERGTTASGTWLVSITDLPDPTFRIEPGMAFWLLVGLAVILLAGGLGLLARVLAWPSQRVVRMSRLDRALALLERARRNAEPQEQRKALDLLAIELSRQGEGVLARTASELAWARVTPSSDATDRLTRQIDDLVQSRNGSRA